MPTTSMIRARHALQNLCAKAPMGEAMMRPTTQRLVVIQVPAATEEMPVLAAAVAVVAVAGVEAAGVVQSVGAVVVAVIAEVVVAVIAEVVVAIAVRLRRPKAANPASRRR